ncbi:hypothetical protein Hypma_005102 [Hypsizygus marmoreus]|uniref:Uncharacterized protein n=1 Tax=Hypsizygus marmoreus TaxID=39966 RepID=A0A369K523_HYPMA|nr:hypothetical protein Hypma_005102 [Hypsizygus marmoreus]
MYPHSTFPLASSIRGVASPIVLFQQAISLTSTFPGIDVSSAPSSEYAAGLLYPLPCVLRKSAILFPHTQRGERNALGPKYLYVARLLALFVKVVEYRNEERQTPKALHDIVKLTGQGGDSWCG